MCVKGFGNAVSFMGSCPANTTTTMQYYNLGKSELEQDGLRYCFMTNGKCEGTCVSSAIDKALKNKDVPLCLECKKMFGGDCANGVKAVKVLCGDHTPPPASPVVIAAAVGGSVGLVLILVCLKMLQKKKEGKPVFTSPKGQTGSV